MRRSEDKKNNNLKKCGVSLNLKGYWVRQVKETKIWWDPREMFVILVAPNVSIVVWFRVLINWFEYHWKNMCDKRSSNSEIIDRFGIYWNIFLRTFIQYYCFYISIVQHYNLTLFMTESQGWICRFDILILFSTIKNISRQIFNRFWWRKWNVSDIQLIERSFTFLETQVSSTTTSNLFLW